MRYLVEEFLKTLLCAAVIVAGTFVFSTFVAQRIVVNGTSMEPTFSEEDNLIVNKFIYKKDKPKRGDIVVFPPKYDESTLYIKRIVGLPGETVWINENGLVFINDTKLEEEYVLEAVFAENRGKASKPVTLGENEYFVMGDNRNNSADSRLPTIGNIKLEDFVGRVDFQIWPLSSFGKINNF